MDKPTPLRVGIDPDTEASGWAEINADTREVRLMTLPFFSLIRHFDWLQGRDDLSPCIVLENIWETTHNWHTGSRDSKALAATKGYHLGRCSMLAELARDAIKERGLPLICQKPLIKRWKGRDRKITHEEIVEVCRQHRLILPKSKQARTNQEERDALLLAIHHIATPTKLFDK